MILLFFSDIKHFCVIINLFESLNLTSVYDLLYLSSNGIFYYSHYENCCPNENRKLQNANLLEIFSVLCRDAKVIFGSLYWRDEIKWKKKYIEWTNLCFGNYELVKQKLQFSTTFGAGSSTLAYDWIFYFSRLWCK